MNRTLSIAALLFLYLVPGTTPGTATPPPGDGPFDLVFETLGNGIHLASRPDPLRIPVEGNTVIIISDRDVILVDAGGSPHSARQILAEIRRLTDLPVTHIVVTHGHGDHTLGLQVFRDAFPEVAIVAHPGTRQYMDGGGLDYVGEIAAHPESRPVQGAEEIAALREAGPPGVETVIDHLRRYYDRDLAERSAEYGKVEIVLPTVSLEGRMVLHRGDRTIEIRHLGFGKTASDLVVYLPRERLVVTGDMVTVPIPYGFSRRPSEWLVTLDSLVGLDVATLVPGHGPVQRNHVFLDSLIAMVRTTTDAVARASAAGLDLAATRETIDLSGFRSWFAGDDPVRGYLFDIWFADPHITRAHAERHSGH